MTLSIKNGGYPFLIKLDLMLSMSSLTISMVSWSEILVEKLVTS